MRIVRPVEIGASELDSTNVVNEYTDWAAGTYNEGDRVVNNRVVWEALADGVTSEPSAATATDWLRIGYSNIWRMFTEGRDSPSTSTDTIDVNLAVDQVVTTLAALNLMGNEARLIVTDSSEGVVYDKTEDLVDIGVSSHWEWHFAPYDTVETVVFDGIPPYSGADINLIVSGAVPTDPVEVGRVVAGIATDLGVANYGTSVEILDYSTKERDGFGELTLVPRRTITLVDYDVAVPSPRVDAVVRQLQKIAATPTLFIGDTDTYRSTITFGVYRGAVQGIDNPSISDLTLQVEEF